MNERIREPYYSLMYKASEGWNDHLFQVPPELLEKFAELIVAECINKIETYQIPVGNSAAGEMACEWTYDALKEIRNEIKEHFGVK